MRKRGKVAITVLVAIAVGKQIIQAVSWVSTVVFIHDTGARVGTPPLWDVAAVVAMSLLIWWIWHELPDRGQAPPETRSNPDSTAPAVRPGPEPAVESNQEVSDLRAKLQDVTTLDAELHAENIRLVNQIYDLRNELVGERSLRGAEHERAKSWQEVSDKIWGLKRDARQIVQRWPGSYFERRPLDKESWNTQTPFGLASRWPPPYLDHALAWFDRFGNAGLLFPGCGNWTWLKGLNFDGVMEALDLAERQARGILLPSPMPVDYPLVDIVRYGSCPPGSIGDGFYLVNHHTKVALDVQIDPARIGRFSLTFEGPSRLAIGEPECFFAIDVERDPGHHCSGGLFDAIREWQEWADDWAFQLPISIIYRDFEDRWYRSICGIEPDPAATKTRNIKSKFIGHEMIRPR